MKKILSYLGVAAIAAVAMSCLSSCDSTTLNARLAKSAIKHEAQLCDSACVESFKIGFYEANDAQLLRLRQLKQAGMINLTEEMVVEHRRESRYNYYSWSREYYTVDVQHTFVQVDLTEEGAKYVVYDVPEGNLDLKKDLRVKENAEPEELPAWMTVTDTQVEITDSGEPVAEEVSEDVADEPVEEFYADSAVVAEELDEDYVAIDEPVQQAPEQDPYEAAMQKVDSQTINVLVGRLKVVKVRDIFCPEDYAKAGKATCTYILEFCDKTPFGYVFDVPRNGYRFKLDAELRHYEDLGWRVTKSER